jgi:hypothetical protein
VENCVFLRLSFGILEIFGWMGTGIDFLWLLLLVEPGSLVHIERVRAFNSHIYDCLGEFKDTRVCSWREGERL